VRRDGREDEKREKYLCASRTACAAADATETQLQTFMAAFSLRKFHGKKTTSIGSRHTTQAVP